MVRVWLPDVQTWSADLGFRGRACRLVCRVLYHLTAALARLAVRSGRALFRSSIKGRGQLVRCVAAGQIAVMSSTTSASRCPPPRPS